MTVGRYRRDGASGPEYVITASTWPANYVLDGFEPCAYGSDEVPGNLPG